MKHGIKKKVILFFLKICCFVSVCICIYECKKMEIDKNYIAQQEFPYITGKEAQIIVDGEKNKYDFVIWKEERGKLINNPILKKVKETTEIQAFGNIKILFSDASFLNIGDVQGCIIDEKTAFDLFGTTNVINLKIVYNNKSYYIRDTIKTLTPTFIVQNNSKDAEFDTITYHEDSIMEGSGGFLNTLNTIYGSNLQLVDRKLVILILKISLVLFIIILLIELLMKIGILKKIEKTLKKKNRYFLTCFILMGMVLVVFYYMNANMEELPVKWSDFSFWNNYFKALKERFVYQMRIPFKITEVEMGFRILKFVIFYVIACLSNLIIAITKN